MPGRESAGAVPRPPTGLGRSFAPGGDPPTTWVVSPHQLVAQAVTSALASVGVRVQMHAWDAVLSEAADASSAGSAHPVLVVMDEEVWAEASVELRRLSGSTHLRIAVVVPAWGASWWGELLENPEVDLITTAASLRELVAAVERFAAGDRILRPEDRRELEQAWTRSLDNRRHVVALVHTLSPQQRRVLEMLASGHRVREIAAILGVADGTVRSHVRTLRAKLGARSQIEAVAMLRQVDRGTPPVPRPRVGGGSSGAPRRRR